MSEERNFKAADRSGVPGMTRGAGKPTSPVKKGNAELGRQIARQQLEAKKKLSDMAKKKVTRAELASFLQDHDMKMLRQSIRLEAIYLSLVRLDPQFKEILDDSMRRIQLWRGVVEEVQAGNLSLKEIRDKILAWNADENNPAIDASILRRDFVFKVFSSENPDATLTAEERVKFLVDLGILEQFIDQTTGSIRPKATETAEDTKEGQEEVPEEIREAFEKEMEAVNEEFNDLDEESGEEETNEPN